MSRGAQRNQLPVRGGGLMSERAQRTDRRSETDPRFSAAVRHRRAAAPSELPGRDAHMTRDVLNKPDRSALAAYIAARTQARPHGRARRHPRWRRRSRGSRVSILSVLKVWATKCGRPGGLQQCGNCLRASPPRNEEVGPKSVVDGAVARLIGHLENFCPVAGYVNINAPPTGALHVYAVFLLLKFR